MNILKWSQKKSIWVYHLGASACNNCDIEILDLLTPRHDVERLGITLVGSPRHADLILVAGIVNRQSLERFRRVYDQVPKPKLVVAVGVCACSGDIFRDSYNYVKPVDEIIPVDVYVPGCPPKPEAIIAGIVKAINK
ncbi:hydrogenase [candidate division WOR-1 bacterium RIFOXYA12_FULL_52_29]|uniref:Hydrogenase n=1 Tax=candidate division WOR-1 bacterium RIFOXYC12_FULL_54_18 TaxID=1802584 RepID=A0A1F4T8D3_UNCSA|nr:MAG: hydrogenase [candidate division WOR-1 bacterium RIFOXYA2_FULL_51_19]OGC17916.1 MAG: hydrogenase [candidate division WOR-1 bacterium RIFOXYA12_FULL_52_29]OGC26772.1 MAG: hydrogenase [candidate division WOR-1 bacterium RIFOXYB2_FULL_45_9]OGC28333.1 MAG: hydrogenase [candidate division WOR-1 bacterium RIFOXYC12_FULL_54_18]OGC31211.1 MAG: hydrogenase [candidate division WOR-1 bacterium RIFOXYB12_FULL_52_16]